ncbi:uncharacterized protein LOC143422150 [Xylocopa sonorina]|uniref:uncharacterized protein LOC143422150 n=1 Tax=Xylocopa sonorina TaxID=1818115 RepID=UPI00403A9C9A
MDEFLTILATKLLNARSENIIQEDFYIRGVALIERIKLLCSLIENNTRRYSDEEITRNANLCDLAKNIEKATLDVTQWTLALQKERSDFDQFQRNIETNRKAIKAAKQNIEGNFAEIIRMQTAEFSSKVLHVNFKSAMRKKSIENEIKLFDLGLKIFDDINGLRMNDVYNERNKVRKRCLDQIAKYDRDIALLYTHKISLTTRKDCIKKECVTIQNQLIGQRILYKQLKEERELNIKKAFLAKLEQFRRNHAAKIIQQSWKSYCASKSWRKRKGRK